MKNDETSKAEEGKKKQGDLEEESEYLDDDVDDYKEKEVVSPILSHTGRILVNMEKESEEYLDDDVDDYREKE